ncbi:hypothetical protein B566_EDAN006046 [Ephemera danica]|nr:hypothetical protein B566_EDAN006046 [Ephemera danica]
MVSDTYVAGDLAEENIDPDPCEEDPVINIAITQRETTAKEVTALEKVLDPSQLQGDGEGLEPMIQEHASGIGADLEVSDSDEEVNQQVKPEEEDGGDLWF